MLKNNIFSRKFIYGFTLFVISLLVYLIFIRLSPTPEPTADALEYIALAKSIDSGTGFSSDGKTPAVYRPPLFATLLGIWFKITGSNTILSMLIFQAVFQSLGILAAFLLLSEIFSFKISFLGGLFIAFNPFIFTPIVFIMQEPVLFFITTFSAWLTIRWFKDQTYAKAVLTGFFWGITTLGKIVTLYVPLVFWGMWVLSRIFKKLNWNLSWKKIAVISGMFILVISPWTIRNYRHFKKFILVNEQGVASLEWFCSVGMLRKIGGSDYVRNLKEKGLPEKEFKKELLIFIISHPKYTLLQIIKNFLLFTQYSREWFGHVAGLSMRWYIWIIPVIFFQLPLYIGFFIGLFYGRKPEIVFLSLFYLIYWLGYSVFWGIPRYAIPLYPILVGTGLYGLKYNRIYKEK